MAIGNIGEEAVVMLPNGFWVDEERHREARLRPLCGQDEAFLMANAGSLVPAARTTALLARCLTALGPFQDPGPDEVRGLTVGDREALLLHLQRLTFGDRLSCLLQCPACDAPMHAEISIDTLLLLPYEISRTVHECVIWPDDKELSFGVRFRLPIGGDQEIVAELAKKDPQAAGAALLQRCILSPEERDWLEAEVDAIAAQMADLDPQAELVLSSDCPECGYAFDTILDAGTFLFQEVSGSVERLYREIHVLAFHYHWSEGDILGLTLPQRHRYLEMILRTVSSREGTA